MYHDPLDEVNTLVSQGMMVDPFVCTPQVPETIDVGDAAVSDGTAAVSASSGPEGTAFEVELSEGDDGWAIVAVNCAP
jgi:hypothetical protein